MRDRLIELISQVQYMGGLEGQLADYLLKNGVIVPPCKKGDTVYSLATGKNNSRGIVQGKVERFAFNKDDIFCIDIAFDNGFVWRYFPENFGKTLFLTRWEAEKALAEGGEK